MIYGNAVIAPAALKIVTLEDGFGNSFTGVVVDDEMEFTATDNDVREGKTYASENGASTGTKNIPAYRTYQASALILPGKEYSINLSKYDLYDYTKFQAIIARFNTSINDSVVTDKVSMNNNVYLVNSSEPISTITKNSETKSIDLNITNNTEDTYIIHYFTYREEP